MGPKAWVASVVAGALGCGVVACGSSWQQRDATLQNGVHTKQDIQGWLGEPVARAPFKVDTCVEMWTYAKGSAGRGESLVVMFDAAGKVCAHSYRKMQP